MDRTRPDDSPTIIRQEDIDPWAEFLSESSEELQALQSSTGTAGAATPDAVTSPAAHATVVVQPESSGTAPAAGARGVGKPDVVRVSIAQLTPDVVEMDAHPPSDVAASEFGGHAAAARGDDDSHSIDGCSSHAVTPFAARQEIAERVPPPPWAPLVHAAAPPIAESPQVPPPPLAMPRLVAPPSPVAPPPSVDDIAPPEVSTPLQPPPLPAPPVATTPLRATPSPAAVATALSLRDVLKRQTPVHWSEAVAVVEELCAALASEPEAKPLIPDLADILITSDGNVMARPGAHGDPDVATMGRTLHALLASTTTPLPLRLFVTSSISSERFKSVALYADALSYYGMPRRTELIRALYERAAVSVATAPAITPEQKATPSPRPIEKPVTYVEPNGRRSHTVLWAASIFIGVLIGTGAALSIWPTPSTVDMTRANAPSEGAASAATAHDDWQLGAVTVGPTSKNKKPAAAPRGDARGDARPKVNEKGASRSPAAAERTPSLPPPVQAFPVPQSPASVRSPLAPPPELRVIPPTAPPAAVAAQPADPNIYSEQDRDVAPPALLSKRPAPPPPSSPTDSQVSNTVELVIDLSGHVASVKMLERPTRLTDALSLQEYKNLLFRPAMKDGHPVQYRYLLRTVVSPR